MPETLIHNRAADKELKSIHVSLRSNALLLEMLNAIA